MFTMQQTVTTVRAPRIASIHIRRSLNAPTIAEADSIDEAQEMIDVLRIVGEDDGPLMIVAVWSDDDEEVVS